MQTLIMASFIVEQVDAEDVANSLKEWFYSHDIGMYYHSVTHQQIDIQEIHAITKMEDATL